jgi:hypothetical protein
MAFMETLHSWVGFTMSYKFPSENRWWMGEQKPPQQKGQTLPLSKKQLSKLEEGLASPTDSKCPSTLSAGKVKIGQKHIESDIAPVLFKAWKDGFAVSSNFAREKAGKVAMAASMQLITTRVTEGVYSSNWQITAKGIRLLNELDLLENDNDYGC